MARSLSLSLLCLSAITACSGATDEENLSTDQAALTEAAASAADAKATAESCFAAFDTCKSDAKAAGATEDDCRSQLKECLPAEAHPGPNCGPHRGKGRGHPRGPNGACDGGPPPGADRPEEGAEGRGEPDHEGSDGGPRGDRHRGRKEPPFCAKVPLPPPAEVVACRDALDACLGAGTEEKTCFDADHACVKAAFDAARAAAGG